MTVSERIKELRRLLDEPSISLPSRVTIGYQITQLEVEIVEALQLAKHEAYIIGYEDRDHVGK